MEPDARGSAAERRDGGVHAGVRVTDFDVRLQRLRRFAVEPVAALDGEFLGEQIVRAADDDAVGGRVDVDHVDRFGRAAGEALALADGEELDPVVIRQAFAGGVVDAAAMKIALAQPLAQKRFVVVARHKANFLAVGFVGDFEADLARDLANLGLGHAAQRQQRAPELFLPQAEEKIALVLARIAALAKHRAARVLFDNGVVARGDALRAQRVRLVPEVAKLDLLVANDARVRRAPRAVFGGEVVDHRFLEIERFVDDIMRDAEGVGDGAGIGDRRGAAAGVFGLRDAILKPDLHRHADDIVALLFEQVSRDGRIDAAAHADDDARFGGLHSRQRYGLQRRRPAQERSLSADFADFRRFRSTKGCFLLL